MFCQKAIEFISEIDGIAATSIINIILENQYRNNNARLIQLKKYIERIENSESKQVLNSIEEHMNKIINALKEKYNKEYVDEEIQTDPLPEKKVLPPTSNGKNKLNRTSISSKSGNKISLLKTSSKHKMSLTSSKSIIRDSNTNLIRNKRFTTLKLDVNSTPRSSRTTLLTPSTPEKSDYN